MVVLVVAVVVVEGLINVVDVVEVVVDVVVVMVVVMVDLTAVEVAVDMERQTILLPMVNHKALVTLTLMAMVLLVVVMVLLVVVMVPLMVVMVPLVVDMVQVLVDMVLLVGVMVSKVVIIVTRVVTTVTKEVIIVTKVELVVAMANSLNRTTVPIKVVAVMPLQDIINSKGAVVVAVPVNDTNRINDDANLNYFISLTLYNNYYLLMLRAYMKILMLIN